MPDQVAKDEVELHALRDENDSLRAECQELMAESKRHEDWVVEVSELIPPSYDGDEAVEAIIIGYLKDMQFLGSIVAKLTSDYR